MPRYINEDDFCEYIRKSTTPSGAEWTVSKIKDMPSADVVEVVRCKDCEHRNSPFSCPMDDGIGTEDDDYCSYAKRR